MGAAGMGAVGTGPTGMGAAGMGAGGGMGVQQEASQQPQADPARTRPDQGTVGWPEQVFPVSVPLRRQPMVPWQATGHLD